MFDKGYMNNKKFKCAQPVDTMGSFPSTGDSSIYGALFGYQPWNEIPLILSGNNGSRDGDEPAAIDIQNASFLKKAKKCCR